ncbi:cell division protein FtsA [bacterium]|nr:cell division protein FtsA [bacterium]
MMRSTPSRTNEDRRIIAGLDIGTSKIALIIGELEPDGGVSVLGVGTSPSVGLRQGVVINLDQTVDSIQRAVQEAQLTAGFEIREAVVGISGDHIQGVNSRGVVAVSGADHEIVPGDVDRVLEAATAFNLPKDRQVLHVLRQEFLVDSQAGIKNPIGISGVRLEAEVHIVTGSSTISENIVKAVEKAGISVSGLVLEPLASGEAVLDRNEKQLGVALLDVGGGTTDIVLFFDEAIRHTAVIPLGGQNVTNDIALGMKTPLDQAEDIKRRHGWAYRPLTPKSERILVPGIGGRGAREATLDVLTAVIQPRMEEIFGLAAKEIKRSEFAGRLAAGVVLTGGGSLLKGCAELAEEVFGMPVSVGVPKGFSGLVESASSPVFSTGVGLLFWSRGGPAGSAVRRSRKDRFGGIGRFLKRFMSDYF